jgi:hypothetical protein
MIGVRCADDTCMPVDTMLVEWGFRLARITHLGSEMLGQMAWMGSNQAW